MYIQTACKIKVIQILCASILEQHANRKVVSSNMCMFISQLPCRCFLFLSISACRWRNQNTPVKKCGNSDSESDETDQIESQMSTVHHYFRKGDDYHHSVAADDERDNHDSNLAGIQLMGGILNSQFSPKMSLKRTLMTF